MPKKPVNYIVAHLKEINTLDWSNVEADNLMSASCEKSIKFWSINQDVQNPMYTYEANFRTVRAKYTPMKSKVMAICSDFNDSLYKVKLFDIENYSKKFHSFDDNRSAIDFFCCKKGEDEISCLILSKDKILRLYNMKECLFKDESIDVHDQIKSKKHSSLVKCDSITESKFQSIDTGSVSNGTTKSPISHEKNSLSDEYDYDEELFENSKHIYSSVKLPTNTSDILLNSPKLSMAIFTLKGSLVIMNGNVQNRKFNKGLEKNLKKTSNYSINFSFEKKPIPDFDADATDSSSSACKEYKKDFKGFDRKPINYQNSNNKIVKDLLCSKKRKKYRSKSKYFIYVYDYSKLFLYKHELTENYVYEVHDLGSACQKNKIITQGLYESNMWDDFSILFKSHSYKTISDCKTQWMTQPLLIYEFIYYLEYFVSKNKIETFVAMSPIFFLIKNALYNISNHKDIFPKPYIFMNMYIEKTFIKRILSWELNAKVEFYVYLYSDILRSSGFINQATSLLHFINNYPKSCALVKKQNFTKNLMCIICETNIKELYTYCNKCRTVCHTWHLVENIDNIVCLYCHCLNLYKLNN
ncbi:hypothetical protein A3Q56_04934 [Intoshia linei]|uniref:Uncharacterized protein n=1 Tax=Intoshia linei TaxID=1819745 RepID=A0A177AZC6_9BILA|nr:hypothetical protein A3Q56_04934 [Intoshia linei]